MGPCLCRGVKWRRELVGTSFLAAGTNRTYCGTHLRKDAVSKCVKYNREPATAFHGKWHLGDIEESYAHNQGFDEAFFTGYNQILSLWTRKGEGANATIGLYEDMLPKDPYKLDDTFVTKGWVQVLEGKKGEMARQWGDNSHDTYMKIDGEAQKRTLEFIERNAKAKKPFYVANWPNLTSFLPNPKKISQSRSLVAGRT